MKTLVMVWAFILAALGGCETKPVQEGSDKLQEFVPDQNPHGRLDSSPLAEPYVLRVEVGGKPLEVIEHAGRHFVEGRAGAEYEIYFENRSRRRVGVVVAVDGLNIQNRKHENFRKMDDYYIIDEKDSGRFRGFRLNDEQLEAFTFTSVDESLSARKGTPEAAGRIEIAVYPEVENRKPKAMYHHKSLGRSGFSGSQNIGTGAGRIIQSPVGIGARAIEAENPYQPAVRLVILYNDHKGLCDTGILSPCRR